MAAVWKVGEVKIFTKDNSEKIMSKTCLRRDDTESTEGGVACMSPLCSVPSVCKCVQAALSLKAHWGCSCQSKVVPSR